MDPAQQGHDPQFLLGVAEPGRLAGEEHVGPQRQREVAAEARPALPTTSVTGAAKRGAPAPATRSAVTTGSFSPRTMSTGPGDPIGACASGAPSFR
ncbi:hypothetical protein AB0F91_07520 [Amycolatopsis sp. NPDC023774]|uniref:hypothetical protein n=1 Tax=Amycolatopsis sp. NPDC023774 TaxID=3155015 RepID=UPI003407A72E